MSLHDYPNLFDLSGGRRIESISILSFISFLDESYFIEDVRELFSQDHPERVVRQQLRRLMSDSPFSFDKAKTMMTSSLQTLLKEEQDQGITFDNSLIDL